MNLQNIQEAAAKDSSVAIKTACSLIGVTPETLRLWSNEGRIASHRTKGGHRRFAASEVAQIADLVRRGGRPPVPAQA